MPSAITHHLFGVAIRQRLGESFFPSQASTDSFLLGNQGPDPLYHSSRSTQLIQVRKLAGLMHRHLCTRAFESMRAFTNLLDEDLREIADAYACGFICHFTLDSVAHPFVYAQMGSANPSRASRNDRSMEWVTHSQIETELDTSLLRHITGQDLLTWKAEDHLFPLNHEVLQLIDNMYRYIATRAYGKSLRPGEFVRAVEDFRAAMGMLYSRTGRTRAALGQIERLVGSSTGTGTRTSRLEPEPEGRWDNGSHRTWKDPFDGKDSDASFQDLFEQAQATAIANIEAHLAGAPASTIFKGRNFLGSREMEDGSHGH